MIETGFIKTISERGYGFLVPTDNSRDLYFHASHYSGTFELLEPGLPVEFQRGTDPRNGKPIAKNIRVCAPTEKEITQ